MRELVSKLMEVHPEAVRIVLGRHKAIRYENETPAHRFQSIFKAVRGPRLIELTARDTFDDQFAEFLLDSVREKDLPALSSTRIRVLAVDYPAPWLFECVVIVPPKVAQGFEHESPELERVTYWVVPAFAWEFRDGERGEDFWNQIRRRDGWNVNVICWDRTRKTKPARD